SQAIAGARHLRSARRTPGTGRAGYDRVEHLPDGSGAGAGMTALSIDSAKDWRGEIRRLFDLQAASRWRLSRSSAAVTRQRLRRVGECLAKRAPDMP